MKVARDLGILLFGKKIAFRDDSVVAIDDHLAGESTGGATESRTGTDCCADSFEAPGSCLDEKEVYSVEAEAEETEQNHLSEAHTKTKEEEMTESSANSKASVPESDDNPKTPSIDEDTATGKHPKNKTDQSDTTNSEQKTLKKPDKILPCPRCNSMDTKFCYYNNYNVNQPRHFCKSCQRYWTCGGTMRNVPVGAGRRKNKNSSSHCRYITISEALQAAQFDAPDNPTNKINGKVLTFGSDSPLFESLTSTLKLADKNVSNGNHVVSCKRGENGDACCSGSSGTTSNSMAERGADKQMQNIHGFPSQAPCIPGVAWPYPWNPAVPFPVICPSGLPMPYYPAPYWNCSVPGAWSNPWLSTPPPPSNQKVQGADPSSSHLGKHSRGHELQDPNNPDREKKLQRNSVLIPKTLRIDDPDEAAKSSIWVTLGIKNHSISREGLFKAFHAKGEEKNHRVPDPPALQANPAALSRSLCFQERA